ncbi:MAG: hypothetical protein K2N72_10605 [Oscillospiraceae bacterium]|nr:hypothetical protein [Oscillospiraceae bacterium]
MKFPRKIRSAAKAAKGIAAIILSLCILCGCTEVEEEVPESAGTADVYTSSLEEGDIGGYIYNQLSDKEKEYYRIMRDAVYNFEEEAVFPEALPPETLRKIFVSVYYGENEVFWLDSVFYRHQSDSFTHKLDYRFTSEEAEAMQREIDLAVNGLFSSIDANANDYEKLLAFHDKLVTTCTFNEGTEYSNTIYGALVTGAAQCEGYAFTFEYLCKQAGIECFTVTGTNPQGALHAWNMVNLDGMWYHVDCTWDDPILETPDPDFIRHYYFLACDSDIIGVTHITDNTYFTYPICTSKENYYKREGLYAQSGEEGVQLLRSAAVSALSNGRKDAAVRFADKKSYENAYTKLFDNKEIRDVFAYVNSVSPRRVLESKYVRYSNEDELIIHISMFYE